MHTYIPYAVALIVLVLIRKKIYQYKYALAVEYSWHQHIANCTFSTQGYYQILEEIIVSKRIPGTRIEHVALYETSWFSRRRLYLRITDGETIFLVCAFSFGDDFFVSYNRGKRPTNKEDEEQARSFFQDDVHHAFTESVHKIILSSIELLTKKYGDRIAGNNTFNATLN